MSKFPGNKYYLLYYVTQAKEIGVFRKSKGNVKSLVKNGENLISPLKAGRAESSYQRKGYEARMLTEANDYL